jgi:hypothetical protein
MTREAEALAALAWCPGRCATPAALARALNLYRGHSCPWCPVLPPAPGARAARVPAASRKRAERVLRRLGRAGAVRRMFGAYHLTEDA